MYNKTCFRWKIGYFVPSNVSLIEKDIAKGRIAKFVWVNFRMGNPFTYNTIHKSCMFIL